MAVLAVVLILTVKVIDHWHIPDVVFFIGAWHIIHEGAHPVSYIKLPKSRHP